VILSRRLEVRVDPFQDHVSTHDLLPNMTIDDAQKRQVPAFSAQLQVDSVHHVLRH